MDAHRLEQTGRRDGPPRAGAALPAPLPWQAVQLAAGSGLLAVVALVALRTGYEGSWRLTLPEVVADAVVLVGWALTLAFIARRCADAVCYGADQGARLAARHTGRLVAACCLAVTGVVLFTACVTLQAFPNSADEYALLFQADTLAAGRLWNESPVPSDAFYFVRVIDQAGKWVGQYPPGWPALLAAAKALGLPAWSVNPLLGLASLLVFYALCRRFGPRPMAVAGVVLLGGNAFFVFNSASYFNHALVLLGGLVFVLAALRFQDRPDWRSGLVAGLALGVIGVTRHLEAVIFALPFAASVAWYGAARHRRAAVWILLGGAPPLLALMIYYGQVTGSPLLPTMMWEDPDDTLTFFAADPEKHGLILGLRLTTKRFIEWLEWTSHPMLLVYATALLIKIYRRDLRFFDFYFALFVCAHLFYGGSGGNQYGPRYYYPVLPFVVLTALTGAAHALSGPTTSAEAAVRSRAWVHAALALTFALMVLYIPLWSVRMHTIVTERLDLYRQVAAKDLSNAVVLIADGTSPTRPMPPSDLTRNGIELNGPVLYAHDLGGARNAELIERFPDREFWLYRRRPEDVEGVLTPYAAAVPPVPDRRSGR